MRRSLFLWSALLAAAEALKDGSSGGLSSPRRPPVKPAPDFAAVDAAGAKASGGLAPGQPQSLLEVQGLPDTDNHPQERPRATKRPGEATRKASSSARNSLVVWGPLDAARAPVGDRHPIWHFEGFRLTSVRPWITCVVLLFAGALCSAGGIGGGGVYVTVLMVAGGLHISDAVPLSKAIVFVGSLASLVVNLKKTLTAVDENATLMDFNIVRIVVPSAMGGTYIGVLLNHILPGWFIGLLLTVLLVTITAMVFKTTYTQYREENEAMIKKAAGAREEEEPPPEAEPKAPQSSPREASGRGTRNRTLPESILRAFSPGGAALGQPANGERLRRYSWHAGPLKTSLEGVSVGNVDERNKMSRADMATLILVLVIVDFFSVIRFHLLTCRDAPTELRYERCHHPILIWLGRETLQNMADTDPAAMTVNVFAFAFPLCVCVGVGIYYGQRLILKQGWCFREMIVYKAMALFTGCLAGLVGVGGGLIFSPFFLFMDLEPAIAVATSSTCVIFTSASTTMQYLFTDRVIMSLTVVYGVVNLLASYCGTKFVHLLQDSFSTRRSYISGIVGAGVFLSTVLSILELARHH